MLPPNPQSVTRRGFLAGMAAMSAAAGAFALGISPSSAIAAEAPAGLSTSFETWFEVEQPPTVPFEAVPGQLPPGAVTRFESRMRFETAPGRYKLGQMLQTYAPGAWSVSEAPKANRLKTVVSGEVTVLTGATQRTYTAGQSWVEGTGQAWLSGNLGSGRAVVAVSTTMPVD